MPFLNRHSAAALCPALFDASPNPYLVLNRKLHIVAANRAYLEALDRQFTDIAGRWIWDAFPADPVTREQTSASLARVIATNAPDTMALLRVDIPGGDGEARYWSITHTPVVDPDSEADGAVRYVIQHPIDVSEIERRRLAAGREPTRVGDLHPAMLIEQTSLFNRARVVSEQNQHLHADLGRWQRMFQRAPGFIAVLHGPELIYESVNDALTTLMGPRNYIGRPVREVAPELIGQGIIDVLTQVLHSGVPFIGEGTPITLVKEAGVSELHYLDYIFQPIIEEDGAVERIFVEGTDVTARVLATRERDEKVARLEQAESQLAFQLELADCLRPLRTSADITAAACRLLRDKLGLARVVFAPAGTDAPDAPPDGAHLAIPLLRDGVQCAVLCLHHAQRHQWTPAELNMAHDMAERTWTALESARVQEALLAAADTLRFTHESARLGDWELDFASGVTRRSLRHDECFGYFSPYPDWRYRDFLAHLHPDDRAMVDQQFGDAIAQHKVWQTECRVVWPDGSVHWVAIFGSVHTVAGVADKIAGIISDITERKHAEEEMRLEARRKDEFLAMLAHELRNPLAPIAAAAGILSLGRSDNEQVRKTSAVITRQVNHISSLINDLLDVSRVTRGLVALERIPVDIKAAVADAVEQVRPLVEARRHHLEVHLSAASALVAGDKKRLVQVLSNLLNNAVKYTPEHGRIVLSMDVQADAVVLTVIDNGIGMTPEVQQNVFGLFTQAERTADRSQGGLGIGLALVKSLVELHDGTVTAHSDGLGLGSTFSLHLPRLESATAPAAPAPALATSTAAPAALKILVVDDNVDAAQLLAMFLEENDYQVAVSHDAVQALAVAATIDADVCLLDIGLPGMDGHALVRLLRQMPHLQHATMIAITGYGRQQDRDAAFAAGFDHHFVKPVSFDALLATLRAVVA